MEKKTPLLALISETSLLTLAGHKAFQLGRASFDQSAVHKLDVMPGAVRASVEGTATYRVVLRAEADELLFDCSCPRAADGYFCKHGVAVGLAWLASMGELSVEPAPGGKPKRRDPWRDIEAYLHAQDSRALVALLLEVAHRDDRLQRSLLLRAERSAPDVDIAAALRRSIDAATQTNGFLEWNEVGNLLLELDDVVDALAELLRPATSSLLVDLLEYAIERVETMLEEVDDSGGGMGDIVMRLGELHLAACRQSRPDPVLLAARLFRLELTLPFGVHGFDPGTYRDVLGGPGLDRYRALASAKWRTMAPRSAGDPIEADRMAITRVMERLAQESGDLDQLVEIKSRNLASGIDYLSIAEIWHNAGRPELAITWAERGLMAFPERPDNRLRDFLAGIYLDCERGDEALQLTWIQFEERPSFDAYKKLARVAGQMGRWAALREQALAVIDAGIVEGSSHSAWGRRPSEPNYSLRVTIALWEQDVAAAWHYANLGVCDRNLLVTVAGKLESTHVDDAIALYRRVVPALLDQTNNAAYEEAIALVKKIAAALERHQRGQEFRVYLGALRTEFKRKRNFITLLDRISGA
jgi:uncharacterized Zn finger protein